MADERNRYQVICGNIGTVYDGNDMIEANRTYGEYKRQSESGYGRAGGESVTLMDGEEIKYEHIGTVDQEPDDEGRTSAEWTPVRLVDGRIVVDKSYKT